MGFLFTVPMGFLFTATLAFLFTMTLGFQLTISIRRFIGERLPKELPLSDLMKYDR
jgi:hypothetical protein